jgi:hypothetical protein
MQMERNVDRLVRSLVGVVDYAARWDDHGRLVRLDILRDPAVEEHQLVRNVVSGLGAGCSIRMARTAIHVSAEAAAFRAAVATLAELDAGFRAARAEQRAAAEAQAAVVAEPGAEGPQNGNGDGPGGVTGQPRAPQPRQAPPGRALLFSPPPVPGPGGQAESNGLRATSRPPAPDRAPPAPASSRPAVVRGNGTGAAAAAGSAAGATGALRLERLELENRGATVRCRVVLVLGDNVYSAIAEAPASPTAEAEVAARVTLDALQAGALVCARLDGLGFTGIDGVTWVVAAIRETGSTGQRAGVAPLRDSIGRAAAEAVLAAVGPVTRTHQEAAALRLGST